MNMKKENQKGALLDLFQEALEMKTALFDG
jgi:hypothetical protein